MGDVYTCIYVYITHLIRLWRGIGKLSACAYYLNTIIILMYIMYLVQYYNSKQHTNETWCKWQSYMASHT